MGGDGLAGVLPQELSRSQFEAGGEECSPILEFNTWVRELSSPSTFSGEGKIVSGEGVLG